MLTGDRSDADRILRQSLRPSVASAKGLTVTLPREVRTLGLSARLAQAKDRREPVIP